MVVLFSAPVAHLRDGRGEALPGRRLDRAIGGEQLP
jgi:hypothetical protein